MSTTSINNNNRHARSGSEIGPSSTTSIQQHQYDDSALQGVAANIKLLLKLIQEHQNASHKDNDRRRMLRVATMLTILDSVKARIRKCQSFGKQKSELRRCNTDLKPPSAKCLLLPPDNHHHHPSSSSSGGGGNGSSSSSTSVKSLEVMCASLGREKEIMAKELSRKEHQMSDLQDDITDLKEHNHMLIEKLKTFQSSGRDSDEPERMKEVKEKSRILTEQLLRSLHGNNNNKMGKRRVKEVEEK